MGKIKKLLWKLGNKKNRLLLKIAARIIVSQEKPGMDYFGWKTCRWLMDVNGVFLVCYLCKDFKRTYDVPFGDNSVQINCKVVFVVMGIKNLLNRLVIRFLA